MRRHVPAQGSARRHLQLVHVERGGKERPLANEQEMSGRNVSPERAAVVHHLALAAAEIDDFEVAVVPPAANQLCREQHALPARKKRRPSMRPFRPFVARRQRRWRAAAGRNGEQSRGAPRRERHRAVRSPRRAAAFAERRERERRTACHGDGFEILPSEEPNRSTVGREERCDRAGRAGTTVASVAV
jgi:hypothetical protein